MPSGSLVRDVLIEKRGRVEVRVIYDDVGCWHVPNRFFDEMREAGIEVRSFLKVRFPLFTSKVNYRNHRKIVVIDGRVGFVGGMNHCFERYMRGFLMGDMAGYSHLLLEGKAVHGLQTAFLLDWYFVDRTLITSPVIFRSWNLWEGSDTDCYFDPVGAWRDIMQGLLIAISSAKIFLYTNPLLVAYRTYSDGIANGSFSRCGCSPDVTGTCRYVDNTFRFVILFG